MPCLSYEARWRTTKGFMEPDVPDAFEKDALVCFSAFFLFDGHMKY